jgi:hypothetical protein
MPKKTKTCPVIRFEEGAMVITKTKRPKKVEYMVVSGGKAYDQYGKYICEEESLKEVYY